VRAFPQQIQIVVAEPWSLRRIWHLLAPETIQTTGDETLNTHRASSLSAPTVISTRWSIRCSAVSKPKASRSSVGKQDFTGAEMQKLHLKVPNLPVRNLQMPLPGVSSPALPPLAPSRIPFRLFRSIRVPQILLRMAHQLLQRKGRPAIVLPTASRSGRPLPNAAMAHSLTDSATFTYGGTAVHRRERSSWTGP
jgi:hypothetical protein